MGHLRSTKVLDWIISQPRGTAITVPRVLREFPGCGTWRGATEMLARLAREGYLRRVRKGIYVAADGSPLPETVPQVAGPAASKAPAQAEVRVWIEAQPSEVTTAQVVLAFEGKRTRSSVMWSLRELVQSGAIVHVARGVYRAAEAVPTLKLNGPGALPEPAPPEGKTLAEVLVEPAPAPAPQPMPRPEVVAGATLFLRREPEGHFTLLLEGPGTPRTALGFVAPRGEETLEAAFQGEDILNAHADDIGTAIVEAWQATGGKS